MTNDRWLNVMAGYLKTITPEGTPPIPMKDTNGAVVDVGGGLGADSGVDTVYMACCPGCDTFIESAGRMSAAQFVGFMNYAGWVLCALPAACVSPNCDRRPALLCPDCAGRACDDCGACWRTGKANEAPAG